jgi:hypothetical protein
MEQVRLFETGATRTPIGEKLCYSGFNDSRVEKRYAEYMHKHMKQSDGNLRDPDNWKKGIPLESYHDSMARHFKDIELYMQGYKGEMSEDIITALCAMRFNVTGMTFEILKEIESLIPPKQIVISPKVRMTTPND